MIRILTVGIFAPLAITGSLLFSLDAYAEYPKSLPFEETPEAMMNFLNTRKWSGGKDYEFLELRECVVGDFGDDARIMKCRSSDYRETSRLGSRTCINRYVSVIRGGIHNNAGFGYGSYNEARYCTPYTQVSQERPEPGPELEPVQQQYNPAKEQPKTTTSSDSITLKKNDAILYVVTLVGLSGFLALIIPAAIRNVRFIKKDQ